MILSNQAFRNAVNYYMILSVTIIIPYYLVIVSESEVKNL